MRIQISKIAQFILITGIMVMTLISCNKKEEDTPPVSTTDYSKGIFIVNEGQFNSGTGTITYFNKDGSGRIPMLFQLSNNLQPLGNLAQSMSIIGDMGFVVVNNANLIWAVSMKTFKSMGTIENITLPRYVFDAGNGMAWVSSWDNKAYLLDPLALIVIGEVATGTGPEKMEKVGEQIWVLNQGGYGIDSTVTIISIPSVQVVNTLSVYPKPTGIQTDKNGNVWIMCSGFGWNGWPDPSDTKAHLVCINPVDYEIIHDFVFPTTTDHPEKLEINASGDILFYNYPGGIYKQNINAGNLELISFVSRSGLFYGLGYDKNANVVYGSDALDFMQDGWIYRYNGTSGVMIDSLQAGIGPAEFCFPQ